MPEITDQHVCGKAVISSAPTDEEWEEAKKRLKQRKAPEAFFLEYNLVSCKQVFTHAVAKFFDENRKGLLASKKEWTVFI